jgi:hypothetical protein
MAYSLDLVVEVTQYFYNGELVNKRDVNHLVTHKTIEVMRVTFKDKNMDAAIDASDEYRRSMDCKVDISIAMSEFGINSNDTDYYFMRVWTEKTARAK